MILYIYIKYQYQLHIFFRTERGSASYVNGCITSGGVLRAVKRHSMAQWSRGKILALGSGESSARDPGFESQLGPFCLYRSTAAPSLNLNSLPPASQAP